MSQTMKNYIIKLILLYAERNPDWKKAHEATGFIKFDYKTLNKMSIYNILMYYDFTIKCEKTKEFFELYKVE